MEPERPLPAFESATVLSLRPGDVLLFGSPAPLLSTAQRAHLMDVLNTVFPDHESIILTGGQDIAVVRPEPAFFKRVWLRLRGRR